MDGVTDAAFRALMDRVGSPDLLVTEFIPVEGIVRGAVKLLPAFVYHQTKTPTVAQIYGAEVEAYYKAAFIVAAFGFDGIDINMGCPAKNVSRRGAGAGLIQTPEVAQEIVRQTKQGVSDWADGRTMEAVGLPQKIIRAVHEYQQRLGIGQPERRLLPVTVKTRTGYDTPITRDWMNYLLEVNPVTIALHGRTLKQMYTGQADWEQIGIAAQTVREAGLGTRFLGNGDVQSYQDAHEKITTYGLDGVLIGRATFGNPWIFQPDMPADAVTPSMRIEVAMQHADLFEQLTPELNFLSLRKHMAWYCKGFPHATDLRTQLMQVTSADEIRRLLQPYTTMETTES